MPIHIPGYRHKNLHRQNTSDIKDTLSLTPLVDLFVVLATFLLQQFLQNGQAVELKDDVKLPEASIVKALKPSLIVILSKDKIAVNATKVANFVEFKKNKSWVFKPLLKALQKEIKIARIKQKNNLDANNTKFKQIKVSIQADKDISFLSVKKIMYTITESGLSHMSFAVIEKRQKE